MAVALPPTRLGVLDLWTDRRISVLLSEADEVWRGTGTRLNGTSASPPSIVARALANLDSTTLSSYPTTTVVHEGREVAAGVALEAGHLPQGIRSWHVLQALGELHATEHPRDTSR